MDGNGRWATRRLLPRIAGHKRGAETLRMAVKWCLQQSVSALTVFAFSSENWKRPAEEVRGLMLLMMHVIPRELPGFLERGIRLRFVGERSGLPAEVHALFDQAEASTATGTAMTLNICFNYGGRWDIVQAARRLAEQGVEISEASLAQAMALAHVADPDLVIRTGGEHRISNFLLWQAAYAEWFFSDKPWPAFNEADMDAALQAFRARERRFGLTSEQLAQAPSEPATERRSA